jgi:hypothetical protein
MIEVYQLNREESTELQQKIILRKLDTISQSEFDETYSHSGDIDEEIKYRNINDILSILYDKEKTVTFGLFSIGDIIVLDDTYYIYYDPYYWKELKIEG